MGDVEEIKRDGTGEDPTLRSIAENSPDSIMLVDRAGRIEYISRTAPGLTREGVMGTPVFDYLPAEQHAKMRACFDTVAETRKPGTVENTYTSEGGDISWWETRVGPVERDGECRGFVMFAADITVRRAATIDRDRFFTLSVDMLCVAGLDGYFKIVNDAFTRVLGHSRAELLARPFTDFVHPEDRLETHAAMERLGQGLDVIDFENRYECADGHYVTLQWRAVLDPEAQRVHAVARDVTGQKLLQQQLLQSQKMDAIGQLAGGVAHDFNNLMLAIQANLEFAREATSMGERNESLGEIELAAGRATALTQRLLALSRRRQFVVGAVDLHATVRPLMSMLRRLIPENIQIDLELGDRETVPLVRGDAGQIEQVILNVCLNARDAMPQGGRILIRAETVVHAGDGADPEPGAGPGRYVRIRIEDDGSGMSPAVQERVFEPFFTTKPAGQGTGLGLATVYGIVEQHGGAITVDSSEEHGSCFTVDLPVWGGDEAPSESAESPARGRRRTILIVEDEEMVRRVVDRLVRGAGYETLLAKDGREGLAVFREHQHEIALALVDVVMPGLSGTELARELRRIRPELPVVLTSGYSDADHTQNFPADTPLLRKPYRTEALVSCIREALRG